MRVQWDLNLAGRGGQLLAIMGKRKCLNSLILI
jgi:hypothetical protein